MIVFFAVLFGILFASIKVINEYERAVVFRLGRICGAKGPGVITIIPLLDRMVRVDLRMITMNVPPQDVITKDNVTIKVNAVIYFRVFDPNLAILKVENYILATSELAQTTLRSVLGQNPLDTILAARETLNQKLQEILDQHTGPWGIKVANVEIKQVDLPTEMQRAMAKEAEAERERRATVISADGEFQASEKLAQAAAVMERNPISLQLRYLQTIREMAGEGGTTILPLPIELLRAFSGSKEKSS